MGNEALRIYKPSMLVYNEENNETYLIALKPNEQKPEFGMWKFPGKHEVNELVNEENKTIGTFHATFLYLKPGAVYVGPVKELDQQQ